MRYTVHNEALELVVKFAQQQVGASARHSRRAAAPSPVRPQILACVARALSLIHI